MLGESIVLYAAALAALLLSAVIAAQMLFAKQLQAGSALPRAASVALLLLALLLAGRCLLPFWFALRIGLYDFADALLSAAAALALLVLVSVLRRRDPPLP